MVPEWVKDTITIATLLPIQLSIDVALIEERDSNHNRNYFIIAPNPLSDIKKGKESRHLVIII